MAAGRWKQLKLLLWKNWLFSVRSWKSTLLQLFAPCFFIVLATALSYLPQGLEDDPAPAATSIGTLPHCYEWNGGQCTSLVVIVPQIPAFPHFGPNVTCVDNVLSAFMKESNFTHSDVVKYNVNITIPPSEHYMKNLSESLMAQFSSNKTQVGLLFMKCNVHVSDPALSYIIIFNSSRSLRFEQLIFGSPNKPDGRVELARGLDQVFMSQVLNKDVNIRINASSFPVFYQQQSVQTKQVSQLNM